MCLDLRANATAHTASTPVSSACRVCEPCRSVAFDNKRNLDYRAGYRWSSSQHSGPAPLHRDQDHDTQGKSQLHSLRRAYPPDKDRHRSISATPPQERSWFSKSDSRAPALVETLLSVEKH